MLSVTTIIAHKNYNNFLLNAIQSALGQTYNTDIVIVDDCSDIDPLPQLQTSFGNLLNEKIKYIRNDITLGPSGSRNIAIKAAWDSDAFMILDADDMMMPNKIESMIPYLHDPNIGVVYGDYHILTDGITKMEFKHSFDKLILDHNCIVHSGSLIAKRALEANELSTGEWYRNDLRTCEDYNLWLRIARNFIIQHVPEFLTIVREHPQNATHTVDINTWNSDLQKAHQI